VALQLTVQFLTKRVLAEVAPKQQAGSIAFSLGDPEVDQRVQPSSQGRPMSN
jgi:hypothetical protein